MSRFHFNIKYVAVAVAGCVNSLIMCQPHVHCSLKLKILLFLSKKNSVCNQWVSLSFLTLTLSPWFLRSLISNVFTTTPYNAVKNAESRHRWCRNRCGVYVSALIRSKTDWSQFFTGLKSYSLFLLLVSSDWVYIDLRKLERLESVRNKLAMAV